MRNNALFKGFDNRRRQSSIMAIDKHLMNRSLDEVVEDLPFPAVIHRLDLNFSNRRCCECIKIIHPCNHRILSSTQTPSQSVCCQRLVVGHTQTNAHAAALVHMATGTCKVAELGDYKTEIIRNLYRDSTDRGCACLLLHDRVLEPNLEWVMGPDLASEAVLQRRNDSPTIRVVIGVRRCHQHDVERQANSMATNLDISLLKYVQQSDLNALRKIW